MTAKQYAPCQNGIHVCGINADETEFTTEANFPGVSRALFDSLADDFAIGDDEDPDLVVDFMCGGDIITDFSIRRQSLALIAAIVKAEAR